MNDRKFRKYKAKQASARGIDYYKRESQAHKAAVARKRAKTLLRKRRDGAEALPAKPTHNSKSQLARAHGKLQRKARRASKVIHYTE